MDVAKAPAVTRRSIMREVAARAAAVASVADSITIHASAFRDACLARGADSTSGPGKRALLMQMKAQSSIHGAFDAVDADFAVALRGMRVASGKERAGILHGKIKRAPVQSSRTSIFPPKIPGGRVRNSPSSAGATPITPQKGRSGTVAGASERLTSASSSQMKKIRLVKAVLQKAEAFDHAGPAPAFVNDFEHVDLQHVAGPAPST